MVKKFFKILLIVFLFVFLLNAQFSFAQETTEEIKPSGSSEQIMPPPPPIPKIEVEQTTGQPEISPETTLVSTSNTDLQKINQKINYLIGAAAIEFLLILILAIKICLYKRPKKEI